MMLDVGPLNLCYRAVRGLLHMLRGLKGARARSVFLIKRVIDRAFRRLINVVWILIVSLTLWVASH